MTANPLPESAPPRSTWTVYLDRKVLTVVLLAIGSGLPLGLVGATLGVRLAESGISRQSIGLFALVLAPYTLKWAWAPLIDHLRLPGLTRWLGRRRGWLLPVQIALAASIVALGLIDPTTDITLVALLALVTAFFAATQDIIVDAWRIESLEPWQQGAGGGAYVTGYRFAMLMSGAGALYLASVLTWAQTYAAMACVLLVAVVTTLTMSEPRQIRPRMAASGFGEWLRLAVIEPFAEFTTRQRWAAILLFIVLYKLPDQLQGVMSSAFYVGVGFTKIEIANASKIFGVAATIVGVLIGGALVTRFGAWRMLLVCGVGSAMSVGLFSLLATRGHDLPLFYAAVGCENLARGMGDAGFLAFLSLLCNRAYTATQYALLSALAAFTRDLLVAPAGFLAAWLDWAPYFGVAAVGGLPALVLLVWLRPQIQAVAS
ncbi:MAG: AmpG family muropeptide transporter [Rhodospirillales bacterium]|nr:AmpG family muropeptide transporter [Rhodospirillales bacterium]